MKLMHLADAHLGYRQYNSDERARDFARAFHQMCRRAIDERCKLVLIAGDLFHQNSMDPRTFLQAVGALKPVRDAGRSARMILAGTAPPPSPGFKPRVDTRIVAIAGNHDRARTSHGLNWLHALQNLGLLTLLEVGIEDGELSLEKAIYETDDLRVIGIPYVGTGLPQVLDQVRDCLTVLPSDKFTILMLHAGLEGEIPGFRASLTMEALAPLRPLVDYLALGHIHKPYTPDGWIFNPGSLETVSIDEVQWEQRGGIIVEIDLITGTPAIEWAIPDRRPFLQGSFAVDGYNDPGKLLTQLRNELGSTLCHRMLPHDKLAPVVTLTLEGVLGFDRSALDISAIEETVRWATEPLLVRVRDHTETDASQITVSEDASRAEIERHVVSELVGRDAGRKEHAEAWVGMVLEMRDLALGRSDPERIIEEARGFREALGKDLGDG